MSNIKDFKKFNENHYPEDWKDKYHPEELSDSDFSDKYNPKYMFQGMPNTLLSGIIKGEIDCIELAKQELRNRGYSLDNKWVGFDKDDSEHGFENQQ
jgi:hypothetical protein